MDQPPRIHFENEFRLQHGRIAVNQLFEPEAETPYEEEHQRSLDLELAQFAMTDLGNAERFARRMRGRLCYRDEWYWWDGRRWTSEGAKEAILRAEHYVVRQIRKEATALRDSGRDAMEEVHKGTSSEKTIYRSECLAGWALRSEDARKLSVIGKHATAWLILKADAFDANLYKLNVANETLELIPKGRDPARIRGSSHSPSDLITKISPIDHDAGATCPIFDAFLAEVQPNPAVRRFLLQWFGYSLIGDISEQRLLFFWGTGRNGKSTLIEIISHIAGEYGSSVPIETFINDGRPRGAGQASPDLAMLEGVRFVHTNEPNRDAKLSESLVKLVTGGDTMRVRHLGKGYFAMKPAFKVTISGNYFPRVDGGDVSHGLWRRMVLVPWNVTVDQEKVDKHLPQKLRDEASGILNRLLEGLVDWANNGLVIPTEILDATNDYRTDHDILGRFLAACTSKAPGELVNSTELYDVFRAWAAENGEKVWSMKGFGGAMRTRGFQQSRTDRRYWNDLTCTKSTRDFKPTSGNPADEVDQSADDTTPTLPDDGYFPE